VLSWNFYTNHDEEDFYHPPADCWSYLVIFIRRTARPARWRWSDTGASFSAKPKMFGVVRVNDATKLVDTGPIGVYWFLITSDNFLEIENCSEKHAYICEGSEVLSRRIT